jgi:hypothetical protein
MCFSATASFSASAVLLVIGTVTLRAARVPRELPFAAIPLLFGIQQFSEGVIWLSFRPESALLNFVMTHVFEFFSHVLWPAYVPLAVFLIEPKPWRRRALAACVLCGVSVSGYLLYVLIVYPVVSLQTGHHIEYISPHFFAGTTMTLYLVSICFSLFLSTYRIVNAFGVLTFLAFALSYYAYTVWFISVWCFFAALLSVVIYLHFTVQGNEVRRLRYSDYAD